MSQEIGDQTLKCSIYMIIIVAYVNGVLCLEQDAQILRPMTSLVKSIISTITLGKPSEIEFSNASDMARNLVSLSWRTGFPMTVPAGFFGKTQNFVNRVRARIELADVKHVERKTLANLKQDLDSIINAIETRVRQSPDGLYTDYETVEVDGVLLEDAMIAVGMQLKAYGVDISHYRNIASAILGLPLLPTMAATVVDAANRVPNLATVANLTATMYQTGNQLLPEAAAESIDRLRALLPEMIPILHGGNRTLISPLSLFGSLASTRSSNSGI